MTRNFTGLLDMDGILTDFLSGALRVHGLPPDYLGQNHPIGTWDVSHCVGGTPDKFWEPIHNAGAGFWEDLDPLPLAGHVAEMMNEQFGTKWYVVTAPSRHTSSYVGKINWLRRFFHSAFDRFILTHNKHLLANAHCILIDDSEANVEKFEDFGGHGIVYPTLQNSLHPLSDTPLTHVHSSLHAINNGVYSR